MKSNDTLTSIMLQMLDGKVMFSTDDIIRLADTLAEAKKDSYSVVSGFLDTLVHQHKIKKYYRLELGSSYVVCSQKSMQLFAHHTCKIVRNDTKQVYRIQPSDIKNIEPIYRVVNNYKADNNTKNTLTDRMNRYLENK